MVQQGAQSAVGLVQVLRCAFIGLRIGLRWCTAMHRKCVRVIADSDDLDHGH